MVENYPANAIIFRMVAFVYDGDRTRDAILSESFFYKRYGVDREMDRWYRMSVEFTDWIGVDTIRNQTIPNAIRTNQDIMNNGFADEYLLLNTCFSNTEGMGIYIFGTGKYAEKFWAFYHTHYEIAGVVDNNPDKWGSDFHGVGIMDPKLLESADRENTKIIMCMASYGDVYLQLRGMGFRNIGLYKAGHIYRGRQALFDDGRRHGTEEPGKKYRVGYVAGVFDLFHIGHLNLLRRAKEMCDYLVVGVVSDEQVRRNKHKEPFIPFEERIEIVRSCRYVDEANEIPIDYSGTVEAFQAYHFDAQFSGSDYVNDVWWLRQKEYLEAHGAELIFFPYTESTSSTMIQAAVRDATGRKS
jgi:cytidyltransferase-like protein